MGHVYIIKNGDLEPEALEKVIDAIENHQSQAERETGCLCGIGKFPESSQIPWYSVSEYFTKIYRSLHLSRNETETVLNSEDQMVALQICLAELNKQATGEFEVELSRVLESNKKLSMYKLDLTKSVDIDRQLFDMYTRHLAHCNTVDLRDVMLSVKRKFNEKKQDNLCQEEKEDFFRCHSQKDFVLLTGRTNLEDVETEMLRVLCQGRRLYRVNTESSLSEQEDFRVLVEEASEGILDEILCNSSTAPSPKALSITEAYIRRVFHSYLELLINSRNELALARVINVPERNIDHQAFTDIKRAAKEKKMPMCQTAISFIMRLRLGGKGYAPDPSSPLAAHVKGLGEFVDLIHKLQTIVEEVKDHRIALFKLVNAVKLTMSKSKDCKLRKSSVDKVAELLQEKITHLIDSEKDITDPSPAKSDGEGGSISGKKTIKILLKLLDHISCQPQEHSMADVLTDTFSSQKTPVRLPALVSQFRSPDTVEEEIIEEDPKINCSLSERMMLKKNHEQKIVRPVERYGSCLDWAAPASKNEEKEYLLALKSYSSSNNQPSISECDVEGKRNIVRRVLESINDQENTTSTVTDPLEEHVEKVVGNDKANKPATKRSAAAMEAKDIPKSKKMKKAPAAKTARKKLIPQLKGQKQLTHFFRV